MDDRRESSQDIDDLRHKVVVLTGEVTELKHMIADLVDVWRAAKSTLVFIRWLGSVGKWWVSVGAAVVVIWATVKGVSGK
jgi:hypothetical protein